MCGDSGINDDISGILITHPDREVRQLYTGIDMTAGPDVSAVHFFTPALNDIDFSEAYTPFDHTTATTDEIRTESMLSSALLFILITGLLILGLALVDYVAKGNAITSIHVNNHAQVR